MAAGGGMDKPGAHVSFATQTPEGPRGPQQ